jgi:hypothetical protein
MTGTVGTGNIPRFIQLGLNNIFGNTYNQKEKQFTKIFDTGLSTKAFEVDAMLEGLSLAPVKNEGQSVQVDSFRQGITPKYKHLTYAKAFYVTKEAIQDELYGQLEKQTKQLAFSLAQTSEVTGATVLDNGFNAAFTMIDGDGASLFSTAHISGPSGGTFSNQLPIPADLSEASVEELLIQIAQATDSRGKRIALNAIRAIIPANYMFEAQRIFGSLLQNDTANNATNAMRDMKSLKDGFTVNNFLVNQTNWFIKTDAPEGMRHFQRQAVQFGEDNVFSSGNKGMKADMRESFGWSEQRGIYGSGS